MPRKRSSGTLKGKVDLHRLVISKSVSEFDSYANPESLVHVNVAKKLLEMGYDFTPGMKTPFIITNGSTQPLKAEPVIDGIPVQREARLQVLCGAPVCGPGERH